jgi:hypothetical protein
MTIAEIGVAFLLVWILASILLPLALFAISRKRAQR